MNPLHILKLVEKEHQLLKERVEEEKLNLTLHLYHRLQSDTTKESAKNNIKYSQLVYEIFAKHLGHDSLLVANTLSRLASIYYKEKAFRRALGVINEVCEIREKLLGNEELGTWEAIENKAFVLQELHRYSDSRKLLQDLYDTSVSKWAGQHYFYDKILAHIASLDSRVTSFMRDSGLFDNGLSIDFFADQTLFEIWLDFANLYEKSEQPPIKTVKAMRNLIARYEQLGVETETRFLKEWLHKMTETIDPSQLEEPSNIEVISKDAIEPISYYCFHSAGLRATAHLNVFDGLTILAGSKMSKEMSGHDDQIHQLRTKWIAEGIVIAKKRSYEFTEDCTIRSADLAAGVIMGKPVDGPAVWRDADGVRLEFYLS